MRVKGHAQASLGADVRCTKLLFSIKIILLVGRKDFERWVFFGRAVFQVEE